MKDHRGFYAAAVSFPLYSMWFLGVGPFQGQGLAACLIGFALGLGTTMLLALWEHSKKNVPERLTSGSKVKLRTY